MSCKTSRWLKVKNFRQSPTLVFAMASCVAVGCFIAPGMGQCATAPIRLVPQQRSQIHAEGMPSKQQALLARMPSNAHHFGVAAVGKPAQPEALTLKFAAGVTIARISTTPDFNVVSGGSTCQTWRLYASASACQLLVRFTPQGAGPRLGKLTLTTTANQLVTFSLLGYSSFPVVSFTPSLIKTVAATVSDGAGLINGAQNLGIDDGDELYIPDTGNNAVRYIDSSGVLRTLASTSAAPWGVTVDLFGEVFFSVPSANAIYEIYDFGSLAQASGTGTDPCGSGTSCFLSGELVTNPGSMATSDGNTIFFTDQNIGAALSDVEDEPASLLRLYDPFPYQATPQTAFSVDSSGNLYTAWLTSGDCEIVVQPLYDAENSITHVIKVAGGRICGFSGDGGKATGAEVGKQIGQIAFDLAGNMYFTDSANNRIRRVDALTGIIRTIAGNGSAGRTGDNGPATEAALGAPTGVTIDSQGQVYVLTPYNAKATTQVVRMLTVMGALNFSSQAHGTASATLILNVANTGTSNLIFNRYKMTGTNPGDFTIDLNSTNCNFDAGNVLYVGQSCQIGVIFKPAAAGARSATLRLVDNTVNAVNTVKLTGTGS